MTEIERGRPASRQRNGKWSKDKFSVPGYPMLLPTQLTDEQLKQYMRILRIEHISLKLRTNTYVPGSPERSPSPEPVYGLDGKRSNTRDLRYRKRFEDERHRLIEEAMKADALYRPPSDYKRPSKFVEKVWLPANEFPELNFIGLLIGPRGNTLKKMEAESGAKISIRGKGSAKEGSKPQPDEDQELHCQVTGDSNEKVQKAVKMIEDIVQKACSSPESENTLKQAQLRELAILNGTIKDDEIVCSNCGGVGHKRYECPESKNATNSIVCSLCGGFGHLKADCKLKNNPEALKALKEKESKTDYLYDSLVAEISKGSGSADKGFADESTEAPWRAEWKQQQELFNHQQMYQQQAAYGFMPQTGFPAPPPIPQNIPPPPSMNGQAYGVPGAAPTDQYQQQQQQQYAAYDPQQYYAAYYQQNQYYQQPQQGQQSTDQQQQ